MSKRRKRLLKEAEEPPSPPPALTGIAQLLSEMQVATLDLHGDTADQARLRVRDFLATHSRISAEGVVHIITGKGTNSGEQGPVLRRAVFSWLERNGDRFARTIRPAPRHLGGSGAIWIGLR